MKSSTENQSSGVVVKKKLKSKQSSSIEKVDPNNLNNNQIKEDVISNVTAQPTHKEHSTTSTTKTRTPKSKQSTQNVVSTKSKRTKQTDANKVPAMQSVSFPFESNDTVESVVDEIQKNEHKINNIVQKQQKQNINNSNDGKYDPSEEEENINDEIPSEVLRMNELLGILLFYSFLCFFFFFVILFLVYVCIYVIFILCSFHIHFYFYLLFFFDFSS
jgi:hypothetical protein